LNRLGVNYKIGYSVSLALRYIPDIQRDFNEIKQSQEARGIDMSKDVSLPTRIKSMSAILFPLIFSSMERIDVVSNAMELRGFGKNKKRTWHMAKPFTRMDYMVIVFTVVFSVISLAFTFYDGNRFYNPFI
jgi:energy-coupling factor transport system permease protein